MKRTILCSVVFALTGCSTSGRMPTVFHDPETNLYGFQGSSGVVIIPPEYESVRSFDEDGVAEVYDPQQGWIAIDRFGSEVER